MRRYDGRRDDRLAEARRGDEHPKVVPDELVPARLLRVPELSKKVCVDAPPLGPPVGDEGLRIGAPQGGERRVRTAPRQDELAAIEPA